MNNQQQTGSEDPQAQFLLLCLRSRFNPAALEQARSVTSLDGFDWEAVRKLIDVERLAPLLHNITSGHNLLPPQLEQELRETYLKNAVRNALLFKNLAQILQDFASRDISLIVLKGAALAEMIYHNIAVRPMVDIDILVHNADVSTTLLQLTSLGYRPVDPETHPGSITQYENELLLWKSGNIDVALELHWSLLDSPHYQTKIDMDWFWQTAVPTQFSGEPGLALGAEALLLHLCSHMMLHHQGKELLWLHDVAEVITRFGSTLEWETLLDKAQEYDLVLPMQHVLISVTQQWQITLPPGILEKLNGLQPSPRELKIFNWLTTAERPVAQRFWVDLATTTSWRRRLDYAWQNIFPSPDYMRRRYTIDRPLLLPLYYPYRWLLGMQSIFRK